MTITRERQMNSIPFAGHWELDVVFQWYDREPTLRSAIITGQGRKAFCAGQDLIELGKLKGMSVADRPPVSTTQHARSGFAGISRRTGRKPIIAAVNGFALGGGFEIVLNWSVIPAFSLYHLLASFIFGFAKPSLKRLETCVHLLRMPTSPISVVSHDVCLGQRTSR